MALDIIKIADYLQMVQLKNWAAEVLAAKLSVENAVETLILADLYKNEILKEICIQFVGQHFATVMKHESSSVLTQQEHMNLFVQCSKRHAELCGWKNENCLKIRYSQIQIWWHPFRVTMSVLQYSYGLSFVAVWL